MDTSTVFRFHPLELILIYQTGNIITALLFGTDIFALVLYYFLPYIFFLLEYANLHFPKWIDKTIGLVFVTPNHHRVHYQEDQFYTDSNYANIFILWDRISGTFKQMPIEKMKYGLKEFENPKKQTFWYLLKSPFIKIKRH